MTACKETEMPVPLENVPVTQKPSSEAPTPEVPSTPAPTIPSTPVEPIPTVPSIPGVLRKIKWAPLDFKEFEYNQEGNLVKYIRQYNNVQGTDKVQRDESTFLYNASGKLIRMNNKNGLYTEYSYNNDVWSEAMTYDKYDRPLRKYKFTFNSAKLLVESEELNVSLTGTSSPRSKTQFTYDAAGNLTRYKLLWYVESSQSFVPSTEFRFSNFDNKKYPKNADSFGDVLQPVSFFVNNPGKKELISSYAPIEYYSYTYDSHDYPTSKTVSYTYDKPLPSMKVGFEY
jgi:hypothetical protein